MATFFFFPPLPSMTGGMYVILTIAKHLHTIGHKSTLVFREYPPYLDKITPQIPTIHWDKLTLNKDDVWVVPEGWPMALIPGLQSQSRCVVYVQNWAYLHGKLPDNASWEQLPVTMIAVSNPVAFFIKETTGINAHILRPGINLNMFYTPTCKSFKSQKRPIRIAWMPRKNKALAHQIQQTIKAKLSSCNSSTSLEWVEIHKKTPEEVSACLKTSDIFLATGFPEGCPLPPLEALACGCLVVGFGGFGGWDYMRQALPNGYTPWWPLENLPWEGNGLYVADADILGTIFALEYAIDLLHSHDEKLSYIYLQAEKTVKEYSLNNHYNAISTLWKQHFI